MPPVNVPFPSPEPEAASESAAVETVFEEHAAIVIRVPSQRQPETMLAADIRDVSVVLPQASADKYAALLTSTLTRLASNVREAADDGMWAVSEAAALHTWVRAELLPWAAGKNRELDSVPANSLDESFQQIVALDTELLGTAGLGAAAVAEQIRDLGLQLVNALTSHQAA